MNNSKTKRLESLVSLIAGEFQERFVAICCDKEKDMSTCPDCDLCPYFGKGECWEARSLFQKIALDFIVLYRYPITSEDFKLTTIKPSEINKFFKENIFEYLNEETKHE